MNCEYDKSAFLKSDDNCSLLLWQQLQTSCPRNSWMYGGQKPIFHKIKRTALSTTWKRALACYVIRVIFILW